MRRVCAGAGRDMNQLPAKAVVDARLRKAMAQLASRDSYLIENEVNERTVTHKLAEYLGRLFPGWDVDCEYNRDGPDTKTVPIPNEEQALEDNPVYPDIIVHKRGDWRGMPVRPHLLVVEARKRGSPDKKVERDTAKIVAYLRDLRYRFGALIEYGFEDGSVRYDIDLQEDPEPTGP